LLAHLARAFHWFNPLAWCALHRLDIEQEEACDDCVVDAGIRPSAYASELLELATMSGSRAAHPALAMAIATIEPARLSDEFA
jgi:beta-lactamase regulating signal transducer with metallopeptidase domain